MAWFLERIGIKPVKWNEDEKRKGGERELRDGSRAAEKAKPVPVE
jgi:hypothetical protein